MARPRGRGATRRDPPEPLWRARAVAKDQPKVLPRTQCGHEAGDETTSSTCALNSSRLPSKQKPAVWRLLEHRTQPRNISAGVTPNFHFDDLVRIGTGFVPTTNAFMAGKVLIASLRPRLAVVGLEGRSRRTGPTACVCRPPNHPEPPTGFLDASQGAERPQPHIHPLLRRPSDARTAHPPRAKEDPLAPKVGRNV